MSYSQVETTMQTILSGVTGLSSATVTLGDDSVLDRGVTAAAIIEPGNETLDATNSTLYQAIYECRISFYVRFTTKAATHSAFVTLRDAIMLAIKSSHPDIDYQVSNPYGLWLESISADGAPQDITMQNNPNTGPVFRAQTIVVQIAQRQVIGA